MAYASGVAAAFEVGDWGIVIFNTFALIMSLAVALSSKTGYIIRSAGLLLVSYAVGLYFTYRFGIKSAGLIWFFTIPPLAAVLFRIKVVLCAFIIVVLTLAGLTMAAAGQIPGIDHSDMPAWIAICGSMVALMGVLTGAVAFLLHNLDVFNINLEQQISERKRHEEQLEYQAHYDDLTNLPNRQMFNDRLEMAIAYAKRNKTSVGVLFLDLDDFKNVNDSLGHYNGDLLLQKVARRLKLCCREEDTVARLGGDEFLLITRFDGKKEPAAAGLAERIISNFKNPFKLGENLIHISVSIGITIFPDDGEDVETLVKNADIAMYRAKDSGKNQFQLFTSKMNQKVIRRIALSNDLRGAIKRSELSLHYQPKVEIKTGMVVGMEGLVRWNRLNREMISPIEFIPLAEDIGIISALGEWVLSTACCQAKEMSLSAGRDLILAVNLSVRQFSDNHFIDIIQHTLDSTGWPPHLLTLEITESIVISDLPGTIKTLGALKKLGVQVSIDDFGTGYSSLSYLKKMPLSELKIDKSFIDDVPHDADATAIVKTILSLAKSLGLKTVAEGVETFEQLEFLSHEGCIEIQGYLFSKPLEASKMAALLKDDRRLQAVAFSKK